MSTSFDLIFVSKTIDKPLRDITQAAIDSAILNNLSDSSLNIIVVETSGKIDPEYKNVDEMLLYQGIFKYNKALNLGLTKAKSDICVLCNNDLIFHPGWDEMGVLMKLNKVMSASCMSQDKRQKDFKRGYFNYEGYIIGKHLTGWCIFIDRNILKTIKKLPELHEFWYSDDDYAAQLKYYGIKHSLFGCCQVDHVHNGSNTLVRIDKLTRQRYTNGRH